jgi:hypothetical protein
MHVHFFQSVTECQTALGISVIHTTYFGNNMAINSEQLMTSTSPSKYTDWLRIQSCHHISQGVLKCLHEQVKFIKVNLLSIAKMKEFEGT